MVNEFHNLCINGVLFVKYLTESQACVPDFYMIALYLYSKICNHSLLYVNILIVMTLTINRTVNT